MTSQIKIVSGPPPPGRVGEPYRFQFEAKGGTPPYVWLDPDEDLPVGLKLSQTGSLTGTPAAAAHEKSVLVRVSDAAGKPGHGYPHFSVDPVRKWTATGSMTDGRHSHSAALLPDGRVLATGGIGGPAGSTAKVLQSAETFTPSAKGWAPPVPPMGTARVTHASVTLPTGDVLVIGGFLSNQESLASAERYNGSEGWRYVQSMTWPRRDISHAAVPIGNELVLVAGGFTQKDGNKFASNTAELYHVGHQKWSLTGSMASARFNHTLSPLRDGRVVAIGGFTGSGITESTEVYHAGSWTPTGTMASRRTTHSATVLANGKVLVAGGNSGTELLKTAELWDPASGRSVATGSMTTRRRAHVAVRLPDGRVLVAGGESETGTTGSAEIYDPWAGAWYPVGAMMVPRRWATASLLRNGMVLVAGGLSAAPTPTAELFG